jgi:CRISPR-associated protein Cas1
MDDAAPEVPDPIPLRMLNEFVYCPRLFHFMHVQSVMVHSADTLEGQAQHERSEKRRRKSGPVSDEGDPSPWPLPRNLQLESRSSGLRGRLDVVELEGGNLLPVEFKKGRPPDPGIPIRIEGHELSQGAWPSDQVQLGGQMLLLEENGYPVAGGEIFYRESRSRVRIPWTLELKQAVLESADRARAVARGPLPPPLVDSPKCVRCSLAPVCLPDETAMLTGGIGEPRRLYPAREDAGVVHVQSHGSSIGKRGDAIEIRRRDEPVASIPLKDVAHVVLFGNCSISTPALHALLDCGRSVAYCTWGGRLLGMSLPFASQNVGLRVEQFRRFSLPEWRLRVARPIIHAKIRNQRTLLRRNAPGEPAALPILAREAESARTAESLDTLMGHEGTAARAYFNDWPAMLLDAPLASEMRGRTRRPPRDPVNAALSFAYALLLRDCFATLAGVGFDPLFGALHSIKPGRPALALDLMEPYRPLIADSAVLRAFNTGMLASGDIERTQAGVFLTETGRKALITAYEQRMGELVTHPQFEYRVSYRRLLEVETRLLARWIEGDVDSWEPFTSR